jgi:hypothetical protein
MMHLGGGQLQQAGSVEKARPALEQAAQTRRQAEALDPLHQSPVWAEQPATHPHDELLAYYLSVGV